MTKRDEQKDATEARLWALFHRIKEEGRPTGPTAFAREAGIDRTYLYKFSVLAAEVAAYGKLTQPRISRRGAGVPKAEAKKREIADQVRREHTRWAREIPQLRQELAEANELCRRHEQEIAALESRDQVVMRAYESLLLLAYEAGVSPLELEALEEKVVDVGGPVVPLIQKGDKKSRG